MTNIFDQGKIQLLNGPSPLQFLANLTAHLGGPAIYIKRDDEGGPAAGGNKIRKFERQFADAIAQGADTLILAAHSQSNCARELVGCAARHRLKTVIVIKDLVGINTSPYLNSGNALLMRILGTRFIEIARDADFVGEMQSIAAAVAADGGKAYILPFGSSDSLGVGGYVESGREILAEMMRQTGGAPDVIVTATGTGGTQAGLIAATHDNAQPVPVQGFSVLHDPPVAHDEVDRLLREAFTSKLEVDYDIRIDGRARGEAYGKPTPEAIESIRLLARLEGVFLDPVYTGKAMAGLIDWLPESDLKKNHKVVFVHTGGMPLLFAYESLFI